jgi:hypothetical protein
VDLSRLGWRSVLGIATFAMLFQQAFSYACQLVMPVLADRLAEDFGISRGWLGLYLFIQNLVAIVAAVGCGGFILRYGPLRISQIVLALMACSILVVATGVLWLLPLAAILLGLSAVSTPASSHILARVCPPRLAPLIFSVKQTGVPVGSLIGGLLIPLLLGTVFYSAILGTTIRLGTYGTAAVMALIVASVAVALQPIREFFDAERRPDTKLSLGDLPETMRLVLGTPALRDIAFAALAFGGMQSLFAGFFILYLLDGLDYSETAAGSVYAIASLSAIFARIIWGLLASSWLSPRSVMALIGLVGGAAGLGVAQLGPGWTPVEITVVAVIYNMTAISWHGVLLAETARLAPEGKVGGITGGVLAFTSIAMMIYPAVFGVLLATTGSYKIGFALAAIPSFVATIIFFRAPVNGGWFSTGLVALREVITWRSLVFAMFVVGAGTAAGLLV